MNFNLTVKPGERGVDLRELHTALESRQDFSTWAKARLSNFVEGIEFSTFHNVVERARRIDYSVSVDVAKQIALMESTARGKAVRMWFIEREKKLAAFETGFKIPTTMKEALEMALRIENERERLVLENSELKPKAAFHDLVTAADDEMSVAEAAQLLGTGEKRLFEQLRSNNVLFTSGARRNLPYQDYVDRGYFKIRESHYEARGEDRVARTTKVTQKGLAWLSRRFGEVAA